MNTRFFSDDAQAGRPDPNALSTTGQSHAVSSGADVLLIDDNPAIAGALEIAFRITGHRLETVADPQAALSRLAARRYDAILLDLNFSPGHSDGAEGLACLARIMADDPQACVLVITAHSGIRIAVAAMQAGARDFVMKPWRNAELIAKVEGAIARGVAPAQRTGGGATGGTARLLGDSPAMERLRDLVRRVGPTAASVVVTGRPGSGRSLTAAAIHAASGASGGISDRIDLRDAAAWARVSAARGTIVLRHPDQLDPVAQTRLLDRLPPAVRCLAIADSAAALTPGLRQRIATLEVAVPPLQARGDDAVLLARHFALLAAERHGRPAPRLTPAAEAAVRATLWADEVRGLALAIERAVVLASDAAPIDAALLAPPLPQAVAAPSATVSGFDLVDAEKAMIHAALREHRHNVTHAAAALGLSRGALYRRMVRHGL